MQETKIIFQILDFFYNTEVLLLFVSCQYQIIPIHFFLSGLQSLILCSNGENIIIPNAITLLIYTDLQFPTVTFVLLT